MKHEPTRRSFTTIITTFNNKSKLLALKVAVEAGFFSHFKECLVLVLTIFIEGAYLTFKSIFYKAVNLF